MALDDASYGLIRPSTEAVRKRMGGDRDATNPDQWKAAIDSYADRFLSLGLQPPRTSVVRGKGHDELWRLLHDQRRRVIAALHYGTVASEKRALWASRSFRANHAVYLRAATVVDEARKVPATTHSPMGASGAVPTADVCGPSGSCGRRPATCGTRRAVVSTPPRTAGSASSSAKPDLSASPTTVSTRRPRRRHAGHARRHRAARGHRRHRG